MINLQYFSLSICLVGELGNCWPRLVFQKVISVHFRFTYLGASTVDGRLQIRHFMPLLERVEKKLSGWKSRLLLQGGRLVLLRHVLSSLPIHLLSVL